MVQGLILVHRIKTYDYFYTPLKTGEKKMESKAVAVTKLQSSIMNKFITVCVSIITLCSTLMVTFVWDLRSDFAAEKEKVVNTQIQVVEVKSNVAENKNKIIDLDKKVDNHEFRIETLEQKKSSR